MRIVGAGALALLLSFAVGCVKGEQGPPGPKGDQGDIGPQGPPPYIAVDGGLVGSGLASAPLALDARSLPAGPNLWVDTTQFNWIPAGQTNVTADAVYGVWTYFKKNATTASIVAEAPPQELSDIIQSGSPAWWPRNFRVLHIKISPGGGEAGRLLQQLPASDKSGPVSMSAYVKVLAGTLNVGQELSWTGFTNAQWSKISVTESSPTRTLGGVWGFGGSPTTFTEALIALPKVELGGTATPYVEGMDSSTVVEARCSTPWTQSATNAGLTLCTTTLLVPWPALLTVGVQGHIRAYGSQGCTVTINIDGDAPAGYRCCSDVDAALAPMLISPSSDIGWVPGATQRQKVVAPGPHTVNYLLYSSSTATCGFNANSMVIRAHRM